MSNSQYHTAAMSCKPISIEQTRFALTKKNVLNICVIFLVFWVQFAHVIPHCNRKVVAFKTHSHPCDSTKGIVKRSVIFPDG